MSGLVFIENRVFIIWEWEWRDDGGFILDDEDSDECSDTSINLIPETPPLIDSDNEDNVG